MLGDSKILAQAALGMKIEIRAVNNWLLAGVLLLVLLFYGRPLLVPLVIALLLWAALNALVRLLRRLRFPAWLAWATAFVLIGASLYFVVLVLGNEAVALGEQIPTYATKLQHIWSGYRPLERLLPAPNFETFLKHADAMVILSQAVGSIGVILAKLTLVAVFVGFLLGGQRYLPAKLAHLLDYGPQSEDESVIHLIGVRIQSYLGVCTFLSLSMGVVTYALLTVLGLDFVGFWALLMFFLTYIPVLGAIGACLPALMALVQFGSVEPALVILIVLSIAHFVLTDIVETLMLGHSLNLSPFVIIVSVTFWGLIWGVAGLILAVPLTGAVAIACRHIEGLAWISDFIAAPPHHRPWWAARWQSPGS